VRRPRYGGSIGKLTGSAASFFRSDAALELHVRLGHIDVLPAEGRPPQTHSPGIFLGLADRLALAGWKSTSRYVLNN